MNRILFTLILTLFGLVGFAQEGEKRPMQVADYEGVKKITIQNIEKDTYIKSSPYVLDRSLQPFVFKFSDGNTRKVYLYKLYESEKMGELGMVAIYTTAKDNKKVIIPIPSPDAVGEVWGKYIDDLKYGERDNNGLSSCLAFVLTKAGVGGATAASGKEEDKYEYCFPAESQVMLADGGSKSISQLQPGDRILSFEPTSKQFTVSTVQRLAIHQNRTFSLVQLGLIKASERISTGPAQWDIKTIEATANHPIYTVTGKKSVEQLEVGEKVYLLEDGRVSEYEVFVKQTDKRNVSEVFNVVADKPTYFVNGVLVFVK
ncbi:MAG: Hint domain-containing protein [Spirosomataceae bacterium]